MQKFLFLLLAAACQKASSQTGDSTELCFASDTQAPMWVETLLLKKDGNKEATKKLFGDIAQRKPGAFFIMGDVVNLGYSNRQWKPMDAYLKELRSANVPVYAALGNHEVMGQAGKGIRKFQERFPEHKPTGYVQIKDSVAIVLLNSNFSKLSAEEDAAQLRWYKQTLAALDGDSSIHFIISGCHHSPYTNSKIVGASKEVQEKFVPMFLASKKSRLFVTGHSHNYEHFKKDGKDFFVIGGGGGLHQYVRTGEDCFKDEECDYKPLFHYLTVKRRGHELKVCSVQLKKDRTCFEEGRSTVVVKEATPESVVVSGKCF